MGGSLLAACNMKWEGGSSAIQTSAFQNLLWAKADMFDGKIRAEEWLLALILSFSHHYENVVWTVYNYKGQWIF